MDREISPTIKAVMYACAAGFVLQHFVAGGTMVDVFGLTPSLVVHKRTVWQLVTYMFLHGTVFHLLINMFGFWMFGRLVEQAWGSAEFIKYCLICGVGGALFNVAVTPNSGDPIVGASAAVMGMLVAVGMLYPDSTVHYQFFIPMKMKHLVILSAVIELTLGVTGRAGGVAWLAHIGGMITGYLYIRWWWELKARTKRLATGVWERVSEGATRRPQWRRPKAEEPPPQDLGTEVDRILDKILVKGVDSLTPEEKATMKKYGKKHKFDA